MSAKAQNHGQTARLPLLPLKDAVVFPRMVVPLIVGRPASLAAVEESLADEMPIFLLTQTESAEEHPGPEHLHRVGTAANILQTTRLPDGTMKVVVEGLGRGRVRRFYLDGATPEVLVVRIDKAAPADSEISGLMRAALTQFEQFARLSGRVAPEIVLSLKEIAEADVLADMLCAYMPGNVEERQGLLETTHAGQRLERIAGILMRENELFEIERNVRERVREQMERGQREHYLQEQLKAIHQELGGREEGGDEFADLRALIQKARMPKEVRERAEHELARYARMPLMSPEGVVIRTYLEWLIEVPWSKRTKDSIDIVRAQQVLDEDHFGLEKVKERILEFLAVRKLSQDVRGPILCLVGPPGVGKTSLGQSIARAMNRKFVRVSLGGIRDEAEIRGHRRTYIGALPGRIIQSMKKVGVKNPVFMLDEIDKMNVDFRGDPSSALLEVLDPAQNKAFSDHYLEVEFDLSEVFFVATSNTEFDIPHALRDRMEIVRMPGYTSYEKTAIARDFLVPKQMKTCGLTEAHIAFEPEGIDTVVARYTREAGVRELERQIASVCRKVARKVVTQPDQPAIRVGADAVFEFLGPPKYTEQFADKKPQTGVAIGMAWTEAGGDILNIETSVAKGKGRLMLTGQLGDVMKESAQAAHTYLRAHADALHLPEDFHKTLDIHIHIPEGAIPKDGPSAGVALLVSMLSALTGRAPRVGISMTGEITLRGRVLPVGGIKEKVLAAHRAGVRHIILPKENEKDFPEVHEEVRRDISFTLVEEVGEVLRIAFPEEEAQPRTEEA
ncbi:MAG: endopeptidase La [Candidatus Hydrogenedentes bacterium]|nr:endopeptidase La [Candidatus Hydrogenedentota bacterium]